MEKTAEFLAEEILVEKNIVTYRYLSRALQLHVNAAKRALFEFHKSQNAKKPGSLHATYLLYGVKTAEEPSHSHEEDVDMDGHHSDDEMLSDPFPTLSLTLVAEEALEGTLAKYESLESIHVYSLSVQPMTDLQLLADSTRQLRELVQSKGLEESPKTYGTICNPHVRRRQRKAAPVPSVHRPVAKPAAKPAAAPKETIGPNSIWNKAKKTSTATETKAKPETPSEDKKPGPNSIWNKMAKQKDHDKAAKAEPAEETKPAAPPEAKKSAGGGGIMQAFAKGAAAKPKKTLPKSTITAPDSDAAMALSDDGGDDDDTELFPKPQAVTGGKSRKEREEELLKMMEEDDDDDEKSASEEEEREDEPMEDVQETPAEPEPPKKEEASEIITTSGDGRRRGKRRIMRKKMIEDENGYLVTIQEPGWESFSEDEAPAAKPQPAKPAHSNTAQAPKAKKQAGQGNIMSFFSKK